MRRLVTITRRREPLLVLILFALVLSLLPRFTENLRAEPLSFKTEGATIFYDQPVSHLADSLKNNYPQLRAQVENKIGWKLRSRPAIYLIGSQREFKRLGGNDSIAAFTFTGKARIVVNLAGFDRFIGFDHTLRHELCHVLLHDYIKRDLPDWAEEGICEWVGGLPRSGLTPIENSFSSFALYKNGAPLAKLRNFSGADTGLGMAYTQSGNFIGFVADRYGEEGLRRILDRLRKGDNVDRAFRAGVSKPLETVEAEWKRELKYRARWVILVQEGAGEAVKQGRLLLRMISANRREAVSLLIILIILLASLKTVFRARQ